MDADSEIVEAEVLSDDREFTELLVRLQEEFPSCATPGFDFSKLKGTGRAAQAIVLGALRLRDQTLDGLVRKALNYDLASNCRIG